MLEDGCQASSGDGRDCELSERVGEEYNGCGGDAHDQRPDGDSPARELISEERDRCDTSEHRGEDK